MTENKGTQQPVALREWVEPEVAELNVMETQVFPGRGADGGRFVDCTLS